MNALIEYTSSGSTQMPKTNVDDRGKHILEGVPGDFMRCVDARAIAPKARMEKIIPEPVEKQINESKSSEEARKVLFEHLCDQAMLEGLRHFCSIMIESEGYQQMQMFGKELLAKIEEVMPRPGSSQVSSAVGSDVEMEGSIEQQHMLGKAQRKRPPDRTDREQKRRKDSDSADQDSSAIDEIGREVKRCIEVNIELLKTKTIEPEDVITDLYSSICQCIAQTLDLQFDNIKRRIAADGQRNRGPFKHVSSTQIKGLTMFEVMGHLGILDNWLNTSLLRYFITLSQYDSPQRYKADYWLQQYLEVLNGFCREFLMKNLPDKYHDQLRTPNTHQEHHRMLCVVYEHEFTKFSLADLLKERTFLEGALNIPPGVMEYLRTLPSNSVAVYWLFDMSYAAHIIFDIRKLFWSLLEHRILSLKLKGVISISLQGQHVQYLIKNALQEKQDLIQQTEVFTRQFHALVALGVTDQPLENADTVRRRTVYRTFLQSFTEKRSKSARASHYEKKIHIDTSQEDMGDKEVWHPEDEQQLAVPIHHNPVPSLELPHPFAEIVEVPTASGTTAEQELLLSLDSPPSSKAEVSETAHYEIMGFVDRPHPGQGDDFEDEGFVDQPHPGQGEDFDDEGPATLSEKRGKDKSKGEKRGKDKSKGEKRGEDKSKGEKRGKDKRNGEKRGEDKRNGEKRGEDKSIGEKRGEDKSKGHTVVEIRAEYFALVCAPCLEQLSDETRMRPLGECKSKGHVKKMIVRSEDGRFVPVRRQTLPNGRICQKTLCQHYPNCYKGDMCQLAHGEEELGYWTGMYKEEKELCLDCRSQAAEHVVQQCRVNGHEATVVVYSDAQRREFVPVYWPVNASEVRWFTVKADHLRTCHDRMKCSFPHHYLEGRILNLWRQKAGATDTRPSPKWFLTELKQAVAMNIKMGPLPKEVLSERDGCLSEPITRANYLEKLFLLTEWEQHSHMEALEKYNGMHEFLAVTPVEIFQREHHQDGYYIFLFMSDITADHLRQAAFWVSLKFQNGVVLEGSIEKLPKRFQSKTCLAVRIDKASSKGGASQRRGMPDFLTRASSQRVDVSFILKHGYFTSLRKALCVLPPCMIDKLVPDEMTLKTKRAIESDADVDYPVLDQFDLDTDYQEPACHKILESSTAAPFLITGPFGAGKTRLLATVTLRILLHNPKCFILIATHHIKTADQYIETYFAPLLKADSDMKKRLKVVRVVGSNTFLESDSKFVQTVYNMDPATVGNCNLIVTTFGVMLQLQQVLQRHKRQFFTHIFVDEGAQVREPETLAAFCYAGDNTKIVIAGDHKQVGPQTSVLSSKARDNGFTQSLSARLHEWYKREDLKEAAKPYQAVMLTNHRSHSSILCLPNSLFYDCSLQASSKSKLHPDYLNSLHFVCTSLDEFSPDCNWDKDEVYSQQVAKEIEVAAEWVEKFIDDKNWPKVEWGEKDLSALCVVVPNRHVERQWRRYAQRYDRQHGIKCDGEGLRAVTCNVTYDIQGREFRAIFICTSEAVDERCATRDPVKSLCDQYVFNTVITRACSLVVAIGNPFRLMKEEVMGSQLQGDAKAIHWSGKTKKCWQTFIFHCLQCKSLVLTEELMNERRSSPKKACEQRKSLSYLEGIMFREARQGLKKLSQTPEDFGDSIMQAYNHCFAEKNQWLALGSSNREGTLEWIIGEDPQTPEHVGKEATEGAVLYRLWQNKRNLCTAVPVDPGCKKSYVIVGVHNRECAFDGALVEIEVMNEESRHAKVVAVREQGSVQPKICVVDSFDPSVFIPVDKKSPRLANLPHVSRELIKSDSSGDEFSREFKKAQEQKASYVVCFDPLHLKPKQVPKISHIIPKEVAQHLLFVVCPVKWAPGKLYPLGAVVAVLPKGSSELYACQVLSIEHQVPDHGSHESPQPEQDYQLHGLNHPPKESLPASHTDAIGIVSRGGHCSLALSVDEMEDSYVVGIHVCNAAALVSTSDEFPEYSFDNWSAMYGQCQGKQVYHAALPQSGEQDLVQKLEFNCDAARRSITLKVKVSAKEHVKLVNAIVSKKVLRSPKCIELGIEGQGFEESTVQCAKMLDLLSLDGLLATLVRGDKQELSASVELSEAQQEKMTVLLAVADELCLRRQGHRGYPELQQTQQAFLFPEAWKLVHELMTYASMKAADQVAAVFRSKTLLQAQRPLLEEGIKGMADVRFYSILKQFPFFRNLDLPEQHGRHLQHTQPIDIVCTRSHFSELIRALRKVNIVAVRQLLMQPHRYPQLGVLEGMLKDALVREEYVVKRISAKPKKANIAVAELLEKAGGKHHSLRAVVAPYTCPFDGIFDIYVQYMLTRAIQDQDVSSTERKQEVDQGDMSTHLGTSEQVDQLEVDSLRKMARLCNIAVANARSFESSMNSVDLAVSAQHSSTCVEAFIKRMEDGTIQLCYPAPGLQGIVSIQTIKTKLVTKSDKSSSAVYTARVTCVDGPCRIMKNLNYTTAPAAPKKDGVSLVVFCQKDGLLARQDIVPEYEAPTVVLSPAIVQSAMNFLQNSSRDTAQKLVRMLKEERRPEEAAQERTDVYASEQGPSHDLIQGAPFFILNVPFRLEPGQVVKIWLRSDENEYVLTPKPQLVELNRDVRICLEHNSDIQSCFTQCALAESSTLQYSSRKVYFRIWEELVCAEAAANSVGGKEQYIFHDFQLEFVDFRIPSDSTSSDYYCPVGDIWAKLPKEFLSNRQDIFPIEQGSFACIRFDVELKEDTEEDRALLERHKDCLYPGATDNHVRTVMHMVVDHVTKVEVKEEEVKEEDDEVRMTLEDAVITADLKVKFKVVGRHNARVSPLMKDVLEKMKPRCEMQLFPMFLPIKKIYHTLRHLERNLAVNSIGEHVILGRVDQLVGHSGLSKYSGEGSDHSKLLKLMKDPNVLYHHGEGGCTPLNEEQITALVFSLMNKFQLIQGPPGTGKSITGAHLAYAFVLLNRMKDAPEPATAEFADAATVGSVAALPHLKCVLYCGPSNVSVDVVLGHLHHLARSSKKGLRILRMYGKTIETLYYEGPYYDPDLFVKRDKYVIREDLRQYALHERVHSRDDIKELDEKFAKMRKGDLIPTAEERFRYRDRIRQAEEEVIKKEQFDIVLCTCNETCGYRFRSNIAPVQCIIDEAGMTTEPEAIAALSQAEQAVLIGDHMQLQPVVKNRTAGGKGLRVSLFERYANLLKQEFPEGCTNFQRLLKQYRMVKSVCDFPSEEFYNGKLVTVRKDAGMVPDDFWLPSPDPIAFCDIVGEEEDAEKEEDMKTSKRNEEEARAAVNIVEALDVLAHSKADIAVITPYKAQKKLIEGKLKSKGMKTNWHLQTIDASQGSEADYVVLSMVRSKPLKQIEDKTVVLADRKWRMENLGMVADSYHLCVALTRARFGLVIIGNKTLLSYSGTWNELVHHYGQCRYIVDKQWADKALERAKQATQKYPPPPPDRRESQFHANKDEIMAKITEVKEVIEDYNKRVKEVGTRKKPLMLKEQRKAAAAT